MDVKGRKGKWAERGERKGDVRGKERYGREVKGRARKGHKGKERRRRSLARYFLSGVACSAAAHRTEEIIQGKVMKDKEDEITREKLWNLVYLCAHPIGISYASAAPNIQGPIRFLNPPQIRFYMMGENLSKQ